MERGAWISGFLIIKHVLNSASSRMKVSQKPRIADFDRSWCGQATAPATGFVKHASQSPSGGPDQRFPGGRSGDGAREKQVNHCFGAHAAVSRLKKRFQRATRERDGKTKEMEDVNEGALVKGMWNERGQFGQSFCGARL